jgi:hypothetical protein
MSNTKHDRVLYAGEDAELKQRIRQWCDEHGKKLRCAHPDSADLVGGPFLAIIIDRYYVGEECWESYCEFCEELATPIDRKGRNEYIQRFAEEPPPREETPVVIVEDDPEQAREAWPQVPPSKEDRIFWRNPSHPDRVLGLLNRFRKEEEEDPSSAEAKSC